MKKYNLYEDDIFLEKIYSEKPWRWYWNYLLWELIEYANSRNKSIVLKANAEKRLSQADLIKWYERNWFIIMDEDCYIAFWQIYMCRLAE